jgi:hypothetical protein
MVQEGMAVCLQGISKAVALSFGDVTVMVCCELKVLMTWQQRSVVLVVCCYKVLWSRVGYVVSVVKW